MKHTIITLCKKIIKSKTTRENRIRQQNVLNIMITAIIFLTTTALIIIISRLMFFRIENYQHNSLSLLTVLGILMIFVVLRIISHKGYDRMASYLLIIILFLLATYMGYMWGVDLPAEILFYVLVIVISGILISAKFSFLSTAIITATLTIINNLQNRSLIIVDRSWIYKPWGYSDITVTSIILLIIATVLWLFNRELKKSERELKNERDLLEIRIEEKTKELRAIQVKEMTQIHHFAEFGKLSSGLFHDLVNPLTALLLNINKVKSDCESDPNFNLIKLDISQAFRASVKMKDFIISVRKQIDFRDHQELFSLNQEIEDAITILNYKSRKNSVELIFNADENIIIQGDPIKFNQIITNLVSNAIDACNHEMPNKEININLTQLSDSIELKVIDNGEGIKNDLIPKIFEPFFSTKTGGDNLGLGLSLIKQIIEESFLGTIRVTSELGYGTTFTVKIPLS